MKNTCNLRFYGIEMSRKIYRLTGKKIFIETNAIDFYGKKEPF